MNNANYIGNTITPLQNPYNIVDDLVSVLATIKQQTITQTDTGSTEKSWTDRKTGVKCIIEQRSSDKSENLASPYINATHNIYFKKTETIEITDKIVCEGNEFEINVIQFSTIKDIITVIAKIIIQ